VIMESAPPRKKLPARELERASELPARALTPSRRRAASVLPTAAVLAALLVACGNPLEPIRADPEPAVRVHPVEPETTVEAPNPTPMPTMLPSSTPGLAPDIELGPPVAPPPPAKPVHAPPKVKPIAPSPKTLKMVGDMAAVRPTFGARMA
jgi:hypothetical protein